MTANFGVDKIASMEKELPLYESEAESRLDFWEEDLGKLWNPYFPKYGVESPILAHVLVLDLVRDGEEIPEDVLDIVLFHARRGKNELMAKFAKWNTLGVIAGNLGCEQDLAEISLVMANSFGKDEDDLTKKRIKLMFDALKSEDSLFSSISVN